MKSSYPKINLPLVIESDFAVYVFCRGEEMNTTGDKISEHVTDQNTLEILIENKKMDTEQQQTKPQNMISILKLVMSFLLLVQEKI